MKLKKLVLCCVFAVLCVMQVAAQSPSLSQLLDSLDEVMENRARFNDVKQARIKGFLESAHSSRDADSKYSCYGKLFDEYRNYNADSAFHYAQLKHQIAEQAHNHDQILDSRLNLSEVLTIMGMYNDALVMLSSVKRSELPDYLVDYYFHLYKTFYHTMADFAPTKEYQEKYTHLTTAYRDSLLKNKKPGSADYATISVEGLIEQNRWTESRRILETTLSSLAPDDHARAFITYQLALVDANDGKTEEQMKHLAMSAISDLESAVREYVSLRQLALLLYQQGDVDRAYKYLKCSMEDAKACNARLRSIEVGEVFPIIDDAYDAKKDSQRNLMIVVILVVSLLAAILVIAVVWLRRSLKKLAIARRELHEANDELKGLNQELRKVNEDLNDTNGKLSAANSALSDTNAALNDTNKIKEAYIAHYMDQCMVYMEKIESYRKKLSKIVNTKDLTKISALLKSDSEFNKELKDFYRNFDETFLRLFPNFVADFNNLLDEGGQLEPKSKDELTPELRIFALIRLGITDSVQIAQFLHYSVTTIYNYRTRIRNKVKGDKNAFDEKVKTIG